MRPVAIISEDIDEHTPKAEAKASVIPLARPEGLDGMADSELVARLASGDQTAMQALINRHGIRFRGLAYRLMGDMDTAEDMVQEAFLKLWRAPDRFDASKARFTTWFYRVVWNRCLDEMRKRTFDALPESYDKADDSIAADTRIEESQTAQAMRVRIAMLKERPRQAISLTALEGLSNREAAEIMDMNIKAFESLLLRARAKLKAIIEANPIESSP